MSHHSPGAAYQNVQCCGHDEPLWQRPSRVLNGVFYNAQTLCNALYSLQTQSSAAPLVGNSSNSSRYCAKLLNHLKPMYDDLIQERSAGHSSAQPPWQITQNVSWQSCTAKQIQSQCAESCTVAKPLWALCKAGESTESSSKTFDKHAS